jgi:hypothetical protein
MLDQNWARWIVASVAVYFKAIADTIPINFKISGIDECEIPNRNYAELTVTGPFIQQLSKNFYQLTVEVNVLLTNLMLETSDNGYNIQTWCGIFQKAMDGPITVYKKGNLVGDTGTSIGCLISKQTGMDANKIMHFGQISKVDRVRQSMISGKFQIDLKTT